MKIQDRYLARTVLAASGTAAIVLVGLSAFFVFIGELSDVGEGNYGILQVLLFIALNVPQGVFELLPVIALLGTLIGLGGLAGGSELTVLRASGVSVKRLAVSALMAGVLLALLAWVLGNWLGPKSARLAQHFKASATAGHSLSESGHSVWLRDGRNYIHIGAVPAADHIVNVKIYQLGDEQTVIRMLAADSGRYRGGKWHLHDVRISRPSADGVQVQHLDSVQWSGRFKPSLLRLFVMKPQYLSALGLWRYAHYVKVNGIKPGRYAKAFWRRVAAPFTVLAMVLLSVPFVLGPLRSVSGGQRLFAGVLVGILFFLANQILGKSGQVYAIVPWAVAWGPTLVLLLIGLWGVNRVE
jgi:lipopolysaccharide export system permease protein